MDRKLISGALFLTLLGSLLLLPPLASVFQIQRRFFDWLDAPVERVGAKFVPLPFAPVMEEFVVPHQAQVYEAIMRTVGRDGH